MARAITGHVTVAMTDHYAHVDRDEKKAAVEGMLRLVQGGAGQPTNDTGTDEVESVLPGDASVRQLSRHIAPENRRIGGESQRAEMKKARNLR